MTKRTPVIERVLARIEVEDRGHDTPCWVWTGYCDGDGYGRVSAPIGGPLKVHRVVYEHCVGPVPDGLELDHRCRVRACVCPDHVEPVTHRENIRRSPENFAALNARKTHCIHGHEFTPENTMIRNGWRTCRECLRGWGARYYARLKAEGRR